MKLNGWQRLWIVGSVLWLGVLAWNAPEFPTPSTMKKRHKKFEQELSKASQEALLPEDDWAYLAKLRPNDKAPTQTAAPDPLENDPIIVRMNMEKQRKRERLDAFMNYSLVCAELSRVTANNEKLCFRPEVPDTERTRVVQEYNALVQEHVRNRRFFIVWDGLSFWAVTCVVVYAIVYGLGVVVRWVLRGFQHP